MKIKSYDFKPSVRIVVVMAQLGSPIDCKVVKCTFGEELYMGGILEGSGGIVVRYLDVHDPSWLRDAPEFFHDLNGIGKML